MHSLAPGSFFKFTQRLADTLEIVTIFFSMFIAETANLRNDWVFNHISSPNSSGEHKIGHANPCDSTTDTIFVFV